jgi:hypothetical protein
VSWVSLTVFLCLIHDFQASKNGLKVVLAVRRRPAAEMTSLFYFLTQFYSCGPLECFFYLIPFLFECFGLAGNLAFRLIIWALWGVLTPKCKFMSTRPPKALPLSKLRRLGLRAWKSVKPSGLQRQRRRRYGKKMRLYSTNQYETSDLLRHVT